MSHFPPPGNLDGLHEVPERGNTGHQDREHHEDGHPN
jgi:hypothetical protein